MAVGYAAALLSVFLTALTLTSYHYSSHDKAATSAGEERNLTVYAMAVGQGDGNIIVCPNGRDILIVDMGAYTAQYTSLNYGAYLLKEKFKVVEKGMNIHIVITHPDLDHFNFLPDSIDDELLKQVKQIVVGGDYSEYTSKKKPKNFKGWIGKMKNRSPIYTINNGKQCFGNKECKWTPAESNLDYFMNLRNIAEMSKISDDDRWQFCGNEVNITVLGANICQRKNCSSSANARSVTMKLKYKDWSLFLSGDFEGKNEQKYLVDYWSHDPSILSSTYYKISHHGAWTKGEQANAKELLQAVSPKRAYVSQAHPIVSKFLHPRCEVIDNLINIGSIERVKTSTTLEESFVVCWKDKTKSTGDLVLIPGYAIYETCRDFDVDSNKQVCRDIKITTNGFDDHTSYVDVPFDYVNPPTEPCATFKGTKKTNCLLRQAAMIGQLVQQLYTIGVLI